MSAFSGWEKLSGKALEKALQVTGESHLDYAKKFRGGKTVFARDSGGPIRLRAVGNDGEVYQLKIFGTSELDRMALVLSGIARTGKIDPTNKDHKGVYSRKIDKEAASLRSQVIRLAYENPSLRKHLLPLVMASNQGTITKAFLDAIDARSRRDILKNVAEHYGITEREAYEEVTDPDAESLLDYVTGPMRAATSLLMRRRGL